MRAALTGWLLGMLLLGCAHAAQPSPSRDAVVATRFASGPTLHLGGIAAAARSIHLETHVGADPSPGEPDAGNVEAGTIAYLMAGSERHAGADWWLVQSERSSDVGWTPSVQDGAALLMPLDPECPPIDRLTVEHVIGIGRVRGLVCFADSELTFVANVFCVSAAVDGGAGGASWMDSNRICHTVGDPVMPLYGQAITSILGVDLAANPVTARLRVTGHFDDPESSRCWNIPIGVSLDSRGVPDPSAVIACRERFVVTEAIAL
jgi:hypothetical protein